MEPFRAYLSDTKFSRVLSRVRMAPNPCSVSRSAPQSLRGRSDRHFMRTTCWNLNENAPRVGVGSDCLPAVRPICEILETSAPLEGGAPLWTDSLSSDGVRA